MKFYVFIFSFSLLSIYTKAQMPALHKDTLVQELEKTVTAVQNSVFDYQGEKLRDGVFKTYMFRFYGFRSGTFYSGDNGTHIEIGLGDDEIGKFMNNNLKEAVETYATNKGFKITTKKVNLKNIKTKYTTLEVYDPVKKFLVIDLNIFDNSRSLSFYSGDLDPNVARYYGLVTCLTYQSGTAASTDYSGVEYIYVYAKGNPNMSSDQIISYVQSHTPQQISRRSWQFLGKVGSDYIDKQTKLHRQNGKVVFTQTVTIK